MKSPENLLIVRTDRIGDVVLSLPLAGLVKKSFPECKVTFLVRRHTKTLVEEHPYIDEIIILKEENEKVSVKENIKNLKEKHFDVSIVVYPTFTISLILFFAKIKKRIGTGYRWYSFLFNKRVYEHRKYAEKHELEYNVNLLKEIDIQETVLPGNVNFDLRTNESNQQKIKSLLISENINDDNKLVIIHPGSGGSSVDLPSEKMVALTKMLSEVANLKIFITGDSSEKELCDKLIVKETVINLAGELNLSELISLINRADIFISNSTGPIHIAAALEKFTVGFYPKILACSPQRWGPFTDKKAIFCPTIDCNKCTREQCEKLDCMNSIDIGKVFAEIKRELKV
ncbi:MAG: glycosyltransferase family 9 protein [Ignavibacteriaceae bacterium]|nr:glycosyltransferase family 9 protein [Ignavibacteriaceae bacterium]